MLAWYNSHFISSRTLLSSHTDRKQHLSSSRSTFMFLVKSILSQCSSCSSTMTWDHIYGDGVSDADEYSDQYISTRVVQEQGLADMTFAEPKPRGLNPSGVTTEPIILPATSGGAAKSSPVSDPHSSSSPSSTTTAASPPPGRIARCPHRGCVKVYRGGDAHVNLRRHIRCTHESNGKEWDCPGQGCGLRTTRRDNLRVHFLKKHPTDDMPSWLTDKKRS